MSDLPGPIVLDATILYDLALTDDLYLLDVFDEAVVTVSTVVEELRYGVEEHGLDYLNRAVGAVEVVDGPSDLDPADLDGLDPGETRALHLANSLGGTIATDDGAARRRAAALGIPVTGSLRVLTVAIERNTLTVDEADAKLGQWIEDGGYRSPVDSIADVL